MHAPVTQRSVLAQRWHVLPCAPQALESTPDRHTPVSSQHPAQTAGVHHATQRALRQASPAEHMAQAAPASPHALDVTPGWQMPSAPQHPAQLRASHVAGCTEQAGTSAENTSAHAVATSPRCTSKL